MNHQKLFLTCTVICTSCKCNWSLEGILFDWWFLVMSEIFWTPTSLILAFPVLLALKKVMNELYYHTRAKNSLISQRRSALEFLPRMKSKWRFFHESHIFNMLHSKAFSLKRKYQNCQVLTYFLRRSICGLGHQTLRNLCLKWWKYIPDNIHTFMYIFGMF